MDMNKLNNKQEEKKNNKEKSKNISEFCLNNLLKENA